jgi:hypothetical protein
MRLVVDWNLYTLRQSFAFRKGRSLRAFRPRPMETGTIGRSDTQDTA